MIQPAARSLSPDYLKKKCQIKPYSQDQWQLANFVVGFKSIIQKVQSLMEIELDSFLTIQKSLAQCDQNSVLRNYKVSRYITFEVYNELV